MLFNSLCLINRYAVHLSLSVKDSWDVRPDPDSPNSTTKYSLHAREETKREHDSDGFDMMGAHRLKIASESDGDYDCHGMSMAAVSTPPTFSFACVVRQIDLSMTVLIVQLRHHMIRL